MSSPVSDGSNCLFVGRSVGRSVGERAENREKNLTAKLGQRRRSFEQPWSGDLGERWFMPGEGDAEGCRRPPAMVYDESYRRRWTTEVTSSGSTKRDNDTTEPNKVIRSPASGGSSCSTASSFVPSSVRTSVRLLVGRSL